MRILVAAVVAVSLSVLPYKLAEGTGGAKLALMRQELFRTQREISETRLDVGRRGRRVQALRSDTVTIETEAREELHMLYPHEKTLRLSTLALSASSGSKRVEGAHHE